ncbi:MAG: DNA alkylation repair protein [Acholeplasmataceae bacterium]|jgi:3-methyladenine DNA glycosylase AlkD
MKKLINILQKNKDLKYKEFISRLIPNIDVNTIIGVRTPILRKIALDIIKNDYQNEFLSSLPHQYYEEYQIHSILLSYKMNYHKLINYINDFLPYINNWATCDTLLPKIGVENLDNFYHHILNWINSDHEYTVRFGVYMIMKNYLNNQNISQHLDEIVKIKSEKYYINMMISWTFAEALSIDYETTIKYIERKTLSKFVQNKSIQKAIESRKIPQERKEYLRHLKI